jgi:hypothetical protein
MLCVLLLEPGEHRQGDRAGISARSESCRMNGPEQDQEPEQSHDDDYRGGADQAPDSSSKLRAVLAVGLRKGESR